MPKISIFGLTDRNAVLEAMRRYDELGRDGFLKANGYGPAKDYFVLHEGRRYDSKAIAGVAYGIQHGVKVTPDQFSGGLETVGKVLEQLGFEVTRPDPWGEERYARRLKVEETLVESEGPTSPQQRSDRRRRIEAAWGVVETPEGYRPQTERRTPQGPAPTLTPVALLSPHLGPRRVAPRTAAEPRVEDPEPFDRANKAHEAVRTKLVQFLVAHGFSPHDSSPVARQHGVDFDLAADDGELRLVIEAKSMPAESKAEAARLRMGLGQVLWYRHRFAVVCGERRVAVLVVEREPRDHEDWMVVCREVGVVLTWPERFEWLVDECRCAQGLAH